MIKNEILKISLYFLIFLFIIPSQSIKYFKSFSLISQQILIVSNEGIHIYDPSEEEPALVKSIDLISGASDRDLELIAFAQSPSSEGGYVFCRIKQNIYIFSENLDIFFGEFEVSEISDSIYCVLNPYKTSEGKLAIIISFINGDSYIRILIYQININDILLSELMVAITKHVINLQNQMDQKTLNSAIECELISSQDYTNLLKIIQIKY